MKRLALLLVLGISTSSLAQGRLTGLQRGLDAARTGVRSFFLPTTTRYSGLQQLAAGLAIAAVSCTGLTGCTFKYKEKHRGQVELAQGCLSLSSCVATIVVHGRTADNHKSSDDLYVLIPLAVLFGNLMWGAGTEYYVTQSDQQPPEMLAAAQQANALRDYLRDNLTPATYSRLRGVAASRQDGWLAVPTSGEEIDAAEPLAALVTSIESADRIYHGQGEVAPDWQKGIFKFDTVQYADAATVQPLAAEEAFTVVVGDGAAFTVSGR